VNFSHLFRFQDGTDDQDVSRNSEIIIQYFKEYTWSKPNYINVYIDVIVQQLFFVTCGYNITEMLFSISENMELYSTQSSIAYLTVCCFIFIAGVPGNILIIWTILKSKQMRKIHNLFVVLSKILP
jgi:hypothetical protein